MSKKTTTTATDRKTGMTIAEIRAALEGHNGGTRPRFEVGLRGQVQSITITEEPENHMICGVDA